MQLQDYVRSAWARWPFIIIVVAAVVLFGLRGTPTPVQSKSQVLVLYSLSDQAVELLPSTGDVVAYGTTQLDSLTQIVTSPEVLQPVIDSLGLDETPKSLAKDVAASVVKDTFVLQVEARAETAADADRLSAAVAGSLVANGQDLTASDLLEARQLEPQPQATVAVAQSSARSLAKDAIVGLVLGVVLSVLIDLADPRVRSRNEFAQLTSTPILAEVSADPKASYASVAARLILKAPDSARRSIVILPAGRGQAHVDAADRLSRELARLSSSTVLVTSAQTQAADGVTTRLFSEAFSATEPHGLGEQFSALEKQFDTVLVAAPHIEVAAESLLLASLSDASILVVDERRDTREAVQRTLGSIRETQPTSVSALLMTPRRIIGRRDVS